MFTSKYTCWREIRKEKRFDTRIYSSVFFSSSCSPSLSLAFQLKISVMLATLRRMNHQPTKANNNNTSANASSTTGNEHSLVMKHVPKHLQMNANLAEEPNTPFILNTPNTCTKNFTFFSELPTNLQTPSVMGE